LVLNANLWAVALDSKLGQKILALAVRSLVNLPKNRAGAFRLLANAEDERFIPQNKFAHLPRGLSEEERLTRSYQVGNVGYWSPHGDVAIYYRQDGKRSPTPASS